MTRGTTTSTGASRATGRAGARATARVLVVAAVALLLAGCIKFETSLTVSSDDTVSGEMILGFQRALIEMGGGSLDDMMGGEMAPLPDDIEGITAEEWENDDFVGQRFVLTDVPLEDFNSGDDDGSLRIERDGDVFRMSGNMDMSGGAGDLEGLGGEMGDLGGMDPSALMGGAELDISVTFPGEVLETNGEVDGTTVRWEPTLDGTNEFMAVAEAEPSSSNSLLWVIVGVVAVVLLAIVAFLLFRRRNDEPAAATAGAASTTAAGAAATSWTSPESASGASSTAPPPASTTGGAPPPTASAPESGPPTVDDTEEIAPTGDDTSNPPPPPPPPA